MIVARAVLAPADPDAATDPEAPELAAAELGAAELVLLDDVLLPDEHIAPGLPSR